MVKFTDIFKAFMAGIARSKVSLFGATITTASFPILILAILLDMQGIFHNAYFGVLIFGVLAPIFIIGLILTFVGLFFFKGSEDVGLFTFEYLKTQFNAPTGFKKIRKIIMLATGLTFVNVFVILLLAYSGYHFMESNAFCGKLCHVVMEPEYNAYANSPHSRVNCVECHIGEGAQWFVKSKLSGTRQLAAVALNTFSRPIETPVHGLRPARETCEACHRPEYFHGDNLHIKDKYLDDEENTHVQTVLLMKIGSGGYLGSEADGIHWHVAPENKITYKHSDRERENISEVTLTKPDGTQVVFNRGEAEATEGDAVHEELREMDCIDCHNRPTHIYLGTDEALDRKLLIGDIPAEIPFIKKQAYEIVTRDYATHDEAREAIATGLHSWYKENYPELLNNNMQMLEKAIKGVQDAYTENVYPEMNIGWSTYKSFLGHNDESGCFRCHDDELENSEGETVSMDCEACHIILAEEEENPEILQTLQGI